MAKSDLYLLYRGLLLPKIVHTEESLKFMESFQLQDDDVIVITYPKSGTTWMQEIIPLLLNGGDFTPVLTNPNWDRMPWLEESRVAGIVDKMSAPRIFVSHMPYHLMPSFLFSFMAKVWTDHVKSWRNTDLGDRILYITYEEIIQDLPGTLERVLFFLGKSLNIETLKHIIEHCQFKSMKQNNMSNYSLVPETMDTKKLMFLRKRVAGDWKNYLSPELESKFNKTISEDLGTDITFTWDKEYY